MVSSTFVEIRKILHQHPETSGNEAKTAEYITELLEEINPNFSVEHLEDHSLIASLGNQNGKHIAFRCELDALPIQEVNDFHYRSVEDGVSHKCGHDGHMAIMLYFAYKLGGLNLDAHCIHMIFQAAEENGKGAKFVVENSQLFQNKRPDYIFALHNIPGYDLGEIILKNGVFTPEVCSVKFDLKGKTAHASDPKSGFNPAYALAQIIDVTQSQINLNQDSDEFNLITPIYAKLGHPSYGVAAGHAEVGFTLRSWSKELADQTKSWIEKTTEQLCTEHELQFEAIWFEEFSSVNNNKDCIQLITSAARQEEMNITVKSEPMTFGEDFGVYTSLTKGAMFGIGAGKDSAALHNPNYDFNDDLIEPASQLFIEIIKQIQND